MDLNKLSSLADRKTSGQVVVSDSQLHPEEYFGVVGDDQPSRVADNSKKSSMRDVFGRVKRLTDEKAALKKENEDLSASLETLKEKALTVEEFFKKSVSEKDDLIKSLYETIERITQEPKVAYSYDILNEEFRAGDFVVSIEPSVAKLIISVLEQAPNVRVNSNFIVKDDLSLIETDSLQEFIAAIEEALNGNLAPLNDFDISTLPEITLSFAKAVKMGQPYLSKSEYEENAPKFRSLLQSASLKFPELSRLQHK